MIAWQNHVASFTGAHRHFDPAFMLVQQVAVPVEEVSAAAQILVAARDRQIIVDSRDRHILTVGRNRRIDKLN